LQVRLRLRLELLHVRPVRDDLARHPLDQSAVLLEAGASLLELVHCPVVLVLQLRDGVGFPEQIRHLVDLRHECRPELVKDHDVSFGNAMYDVVTFRSEERRVGKECRSWWSWYYLK